MPEDIAAQRRCVWSVIGRPVCNRPATHALYRADRAPFTLCAYHAGVARRDGWIGVRKLPSGLR